jgi:hypothetical protein
VEQSEGVHQLESGAGIDVELIVGTTSGTDVPPVAERWSEALAAGQHEPADLVDGLGEIGIERGPPFGLGAQQLVEAGFDVVRNGAETGRR